jgi:hypothetical protein
MSPIPSETSSAQGNASIVVRRAIPDDLRHGQRCGIQASATLERFKECIGCHTCHARHYCRLRKKWTSTRQLNHRCLIKGTDQPYKIKPPPTIDIDDLKTIVHVHREKTILSHVDPRDLTLWKVRTSYLRERMRFMNYPATGQH